jgi:hypothetical protein
LALEVAGCSGGGDVVVVASLDGASGSAGGTSSFCARTVEDTRATAVKIHRENRKDVIER